ncbi:MAG: hypothetical protein ABJF11_14415 [Reichenbachiella sp.]|uniref:hypothetical protein n=1 Tax=Reichenbachiella sp. TaxID=2184521 RepID=UPI00326312BF
MSIVAILNIYIPWDGAVELRTFVQAMLVVFITWAVLYAILRLFTTEAFLSLAFISKVKSNILLFITISLLYSAIISGSDFVGRLNDGKLHTICGRPAGWEQELAVSARWIDSRSLTAHFHHMLELIKSDPSEAFDYGHKFLLLHKHILTIEKRELVTLEEELLLVENHCLILREMYGEGFILQTDIDVAKIHHLVLPLTVQYLIENAVAHNQILEESPLLITIKTAGNQLVVQNNVQLTTDRGDDISSNLSAVIARYRLYAQEKFERKDDGNYFTVRLPLLEPSQS